MKRNDEAKGRQRGASSALRSRITKWSCEGTNQRLSSNRRHIKKKKLGDKDLNSAEQTLTSDSAIEPRRVRED
jgi:hypothetical protein